MLGIASLDLVFWDLCESGLASIPPDSLRLLFALWLSDVATFIELLCVVVVGVLSAKLMVSSQSMAAWFKAAMNSSFESES